MAARQLIRCVNHGCLHDNGVPESTHATPHEATRGVLAVVATCRLMATVRHDRVVVVDRVPVLAPLRGGTGAGLDARPTTAASQLL